MHIRKPLPLGGWLIIALLLLGAFAIITLPKLSLLWQGVTTQGVTTDERLGTCGKHGTGICARLNTSGLHPVAPIL